VGRRPTQRSSTAHCANAPIMPEKCAPDGYSNGWLVLVHVLLMMTVYSAGVVGTAAAGGAAGGLGASLPHATRENDEC